MLEENESEFLRNLAKEYFRIRADVEELHNVNSSLQVGRFHHSVFADLLRCRQQELGGLEAISSQLQEEVDEAASPAVSFFQRLLRRTSAPSSQSPATEQQEAQRRTEIDERLYHIQSLEHSKHALAGYLDSLLRRQEYLTSTTWNWQEETARILAQIFTVPTRFPGSEELFLLSETAAEGFVTAQRDLQVACKAHHLILRCSQSQRMCMARLDKAIKQNRKLKTNEAINQLSTQALIFCRRQLLAASELALHASYMHNPTEVCSELQSALSTELSCISEFADAFLSSEQFATTSEKIRLLAISESIKSVAEERLQEALRASLARLQETQRVAELAHQKDVDARSALEQCRLKILADLAGVPTVSESDTSNPGCSVSQQCNNHSTQGFWREDLPPYTPSSPLASFH